MTLSEVAAKTCTRCPGKHHAKGYCHHHYNKHTYAGLISPDLVDAEPVRRRIREHAARGRTPDALGLLAGVAHDTPGAILRGTRRVWPRTAELILAVPLPPTTIGTLRRVRALARAGWSLRDVARGAGLGHKTLSTALYLTPVPPYVSVPVAAFYDRVPAERPGPNAHAAKIAAAKGHAPAMAWEGVDIDDPRARPLGVRAPESPAVAA